MKQMVSMAALACAIVATVRSTSAQAQTVLPPPPRPVMVVERPVLPNPTFPNPPFNRPGVVPAIRPIEFDVKNPYLNVYNLNLQQQLPWDTVVTVGYAGSRGIHLLRNTDFNIGVPTRLSDGTWFFPNNAPRVGISSARMCSCTA